MYTKRLPSEMKDTSQCRSWSMDSAHITGNMILYFCSHIILIKKILEEMKFVVRKELPFIYTFLMIPRRRV